MRHNTPFRFLLPFLFCFSLLAQGTASIQFTQSFSSATTGTYVPNDPTLAGGPQGSVGFRMVYYIQPGSGTVSAISVELDGAATSGGSYTALTPAVGGGSGSGSTTNPAITSPQGQNNLCCDYYPFLKIKVNTLTVSTGSPILIVKVIGYAGTTAAAGGSGGGGRGGITALTQDVTASGSGSVAATVVGIDTVPLCSGFAPTNGQFIKYTTGGSPNPCYTAGVPAGGGTIATTTNALVGDGAGNAIAASGTGTNCLLVNGGNTSCAGGGGGSAGTGLTVYSGLAGISMSGATIYFPVGGGSLANATEASVQTFQGSAGTVSGFGASISAALGTTVGANNVVVLTWRKNATGQSVTCTITNPATTCSDTTHSFTFAAGDNLDIQAVFTGTISATPVWVMDAGISTGTLGAIIGTANFSMATGAITNAHYGGCISSVTFTSDGHFTVNLSPSQVNFSIAFAGSDATSSGVSIYLNQAASPNFNASTSSISVYVLDGLLDAFINPSQVTVMIAQM